MKLVRKLEHENCPRSDLCESLGDVATKLGLKGISIDYYEQAGYERFNSSVLSRTSDCNSNHTIGGSIIELLVRLVV